MLASPFSLSIALVVSLCVQTAPIPGVESAPINRVCPVSQEPIGEQAVTVVLWGHSIAFGSEESSKSFLATPSIDQQEFVLSHLEPINSGCPIDGTPTARCESGVLSGGFAVACCDESCAEQFRAWDPGKAGVFIRRFEEPINDAVCPQTGDDLVADDPYYVAHDGRLLQLCCDYCLMEWRYQPALRDDALRRALGIEIEQPKIALP